MAYIQTEITADGIIEAMNEDAGFAQEMWRAIADGLHKGLLLDNACDLLRAIPVAECVFITQQLKMIPDFLADCLDHETGKDPD